MINKCIIEGRLTKDIETRLTADGKTVARFSIANNMGTKKNPRTNFIDAVAFGNTADFLNQYAKKGDCACFEGEWNSGSYTKADGTKVYTNTLYVNNVSLQFRGNNQADAENGTPNADPVPNGFEQLNEDIPF